MKNLFPPLSRRDALKFGTGAMLTAPIALTAGCNANTWIQTALADLPTVLQIITTILAIIGKGNADPALLAKVNQVGAEVQKDLTLAQQLITQYQANPQKTLLAQIDAAMNEAMNNLQALLAAFHVSDSNLQATVSAALGGAITIVLAIQSLIPPPPTATAKRATLAKSAQTNGADIVHESFNVIMAATGRPERL